MNSFIAWIGGKKLLEKRDCKRFQVLRLTMVCGGFWWSWMDSV